MNLPTLLGGHGRDAAGHRWSGWPGAYCFYCGSEDRRETCAVECDPEENCDVHKNPPCAASEDIKKKVDLEMNP